MLKIKTFFHLYKRHLFLLLFFLIIVFTLKNNFLSKNSIEKMDREKYIYVTGGTPSFLITSIDNSNFNVITDDYNNLSSVGFLKKYTSVLSNSINREKVVSESVIVKRRCNLISLKDFNYEEEFHFNELKRIIEWASRAQNEESEIDKADLELFYKYLMYKSIGGIEQYTWYLQPLFEYSTEFYQVLLPESSNYLLSQDFIDDDMYLGKVDLFNENKISFKEFINNSKNNIDDFEYDEADEYYLLNKLFIKNMIDELKRNYNNLEAVSDSESKRILKEDYEELMSLLIKAVNNEISIINVI